MKTLPVALYLTSPDYLGFCTDIQGLAAVCHRFDVLLLVDNAHGAYLKFLSPSRHPIDLGADLCCDSAHKTLPALTGAAYLHVSKNAPAGLAEHAKLALSLFGSTSPSYLILQSLDALNAYLADSYPLRLSAFCDRLRACRDRLTAHGFCLCGDEPLKLTLHTKPYGYEGCELADLLLLQNIVCEFSDRDFLVMMWTPENTEEDLLRLTDVLCAIPRRTPIFEVAPTPSLPQRVLSPKEALLSPTVTLPLRACLGRTLAALSLSCPPAVPIAVCGERLDEETIACLSYYGVTECTVIQE